MAGYKGQQGRKRTPTKILQLRGSRRSQGREHEPQPGSASLDPPKWLQPAGRRVWRGYAPALHALGLLTELDVEMLAQACLLVAAARTLPPGGKDHIRAVEAAFRILARFGFSPADRAKISVTPKTEDRFEEFLSKKVKR